MTNETIGEAAFETLAGTPETPAEARNGIRHVVSLSLTKLADGLINPKLVLSYLLNALGAPLGARPPTAPGSSGHSGAGNRLIPSGSPPISAASKTGRR